MPPRSVPPTPSSVAPVASPASSLPALAGLSDEMRRDLLQAQRAALAESNIKLPQVKIMAAGAGLFEFADTRDNMREFQGVVLGSHGRNVLWDLPYGTQRPDDDPPTPACSSNDAKFAVPRMGYKNHALSRAASVPAVGNERIACGTCPYNAWGSKGLIPALLRAGETAETARGKACVNQRIVYVMVPGRQTPVELVLPPTSIVAFDEYLGTLLNRGIPVQAVLTAISQDVARRGTLAWGQAKFAQADPLDQETFTRAITMRQDWLATIEGRAGDVVILPDDVAEPVASGVSEDNGDIPF